MAGYHNLLYLVLPSVINTLYIQFGYQSGAVSDGSITFGITYNSAPTVIGSKISNRGGASYDKENFITAVPTKTGFSYGNKYGIGFSWAAFGY